MQTRYLMAALVALTYLVFCVMTFLRHRRAQQLQLAQWGTVQATGPQTVLVVFASQTGTAEQLAWQTAQSLRSGGLVVRVLPAGQLTDADLQATRLALFVASTTGEGDAPDDASALARQLGSSDSTALPDLRFGVLALGDRSISNTAPSGMRCTPGCAAAMRSRCSMPSRWITGMRARCGIGSINWVS